MNSSSPAGRRKAELVKAKPAQAAAGRTLPELEHVIGEGLGTFVEVGRALVEIKARGLYKQAGFATWEDYCRQRWAISGSYANRQITAAATAEELAQVGVKVPNEHVARLAKRHVGMIKLRVKGRGQDPTNALRDVIRQEQLRPQQSRRSLDHPSSNGANLARRQPPREREPLSLDSWQEQVDQLVANFNDRVRRLTNDLAREDRPRAAELARKAVQRILEEVA